jgi:hypothetical protein
MILPLVDFLKPGLFTWRRTWKVLAWGGILTALLCGSKLYATAEYMRFFPRVVHDEFPVSWIIGLRGMLFQLAGALNANPLLALIHKTSATYTVRLMDWTKTPYGFWELDSSITPGLLLMLVFGAFRVLVHKPQIETRAVTFKKLIAGLCLLFAILLTVEFSIAKGSLYDVISQLPVMQSLHVVPRFTSAFILPLAILGAKTFDVWTAKWKSDAGVYIAFGVLAGISLASMWSYYRMPLEIQVRFFDITPLSKTYQRSSAGESFPVTQIIPDMNDYEVFMLKASNITHHYDPLFRDNNVLLKPQVHEGPVLDQQDGYFNMTNPSGLVFPEVNNSKPFERIPVSDYQKLLDFVNRRKSDWKIPWTQSMLDWAAAITFAVEILAMLILPFLRRNKFQFAHQRGSLL